jgi:pyruvate,water dikinase
MVAPDAAGVLFTADPVTSNRNVASIEATVGLGDALVSGRVTPDVVTVRDGAIVTTAIATKQFAVRGAPAGGTVEQAIAPALQDQPALTDAQAVRLADLGRLIEAHLGCPQDIEWCLVDDEFQIVQSRPITTLFPVPAVGDGGVHVFVSVGHQQMMTDPMKPLGLSLFQLIAGRPMYEAAGRLFVDVAADLASPASRARLLALGRSDPLIGDALQTIVDREVVPTHDDGDGAGLAPPAGPTTMIDPDPDLVTELMARTQASISALQRDIEGKSGVELLDFIVADLPEMKRILFDPQGHQVFMTAIEATWWLNDHLQEWLGEKNAADTLAQSVPHNVTSEMGLALLDVADVIRPHPDVVASLQDVDDEDFLDELPKLAGGQEARDAIEAYLDRYGMRCVGEIDITRPRWSERPTTLVPMILANVRNFEPGAGARRFEDGRREAWTKERELLERLRALPDGAAKAAEVELMIDRVRTFMGYREYPKYGKVCRDFVYKRALFEEAGRLVAAGVLREADDISYLTFHELHDVVRTGRADQQLIDGRKDAFRSYHALTPPRVLTSDGEVVAGAYRRDDAPAGALLGLPVSAGTVEGRARVIVDVAGASFDAGDILVTAFTDPSWSPAFVTIAGLVTEVGGQMTHGAVIAREYGVPAVVGVEHATHLIRDGQRIRVNGTDGYVEILADP